MDMDNTRRDSQREDFDMRVMWLHSGLMPSACQALGYESDIRCGWLESMLNALSRVDSSVEFCMLGLDPRPCDIKIGNVRHISLECSYVPQYRRIPVMLQKRAKAAILDFKPDLIHVQGTEYFYGCFDEDVYAGVPVVVSLQGMINGCHAHYNGELSPYELRGVNFNARYFLFGRTIFSTQNTWRTVRSRQERRILRQHRYFIGRTEWDRSCVKFYNNSAVYFKVNENIRKPFFEIRRDLATVVPRTIFCGAAAAYPLKGVHWLMRAVASLKDEFPDIQLRIADAQGVKSRGFLRDFLSGHSYQRYLNRLIKELGIQGHIDLLPRLEAVDVAKELASAELFVLPSLCENSPNSLGEAMLVGTPAIATCCGGMQSMLVDGTEGRIVPPGDPFLLAEAIRQSFLFPDNAERMAEAARATALTRHDAVLNAEAMLRTYKEIVAK